MTRGPKFEENVFSHHTKFTTTRDNLGCLCPPIHFTQTLRLPRTADIGPAAAAKGVEPRDRHDPNIQDGGKWVCESVIQLEVNGQRSFLAIAGLSNALQLLGARRFEKCTKQAMNEPIVRFTPISVDA